MMVGNEFINYSDSITDELQKIINDNSIECDDTSPFMTTNLFAFKFSSLNTQQEAVRVIIEHFPFEEKDSMRRCPVDSIYLNDKLISLDEISFYEKLKRLLVEGMVTEIPMFMNEPEKADHFIEKVKELKPKQFYSCQNPILISKYCNDQSLFMFAGNTIFFFLFLGYD